MRVATSLILSAVPVLGFACTGEDAGAGAHGGGAHGGGAGSGRGGVAGAGVGAAGSGIANGGASWAGAAGSGGNAMGGNGGSASGGGAGGESGGDPGGGGGQGGNVIDPSVLVFSRTLGFDHDSIGAGVSALASLASERGWELVATEDQAVFSDAGLAPFNVVVFLSTTGDVLDSDQEASLERFVRAGNGWVGIHSASDTEYSWPFYGGLVGAYFREHPSIQEALVRVETAAHPATAALPTTFRRTDEWYAFATNPRPSVTVLLTLDESSYAPGTSAMGGDHPIAWSHAYEGGRAFYTALGHTTESYAEPNFLAHVAGGIEWAAGRD